MANAIHSGTAVSASEKLWTVSASSATEPESRTTTELEHGGDAQRHERDLDRPDPPPVARERGVERIGRVVAVAHDGARPSRRAARWGGRGRGSSRAVTALDVVVVRRVDVVRVGPVIVRMIRSVRRRRLVLVRTRPIAHRAIVRSIRTSGTTQINATTTYSANATNGANGTGRRAIGTASA